MGEAYQSKDELRRAAMRRFHVGEKILVDSKFLGWRTDAAQKKSFQIVAFHPDFVTLRTKEGFTCSLHYLVLEKHAESYG